MVTRRSLMLVSLGAVSVLGLWAWHSSGAADKQAEAQKSAIVRWDEAKANRADWGEMRRYFTADTAATTSVLVAAAVIEPGKAVHRAHRHAEEEYLALVEGTGTWSLDCKEYPAKKGDVLYAEPWAYHGLTNTGSEKLVFFVVRYSGKGVQPPPRPDNRPDEM